jgi:hypothetical protein
MKLIQNLGRWVKALAGWLAEPWRVWVTVSVVLLVPAAASQLPATAAEPLLRYCGLVAQLLGIQTVVSGLQSKQRLFNRPGFAETVRLWIHRRPRWGAKPQTVVTTGTASLSLSVGRVSIWRDARPDAPVEERLAALEANPATLRTELTETTKEFQEATRKTREAVDAENRRRESAVAALRTQLEGLGAEGLHIELWGVVWLILGVVLATIPGEVVWMLHGFK